MPRLAALACASTTDFMAKPSYVISLLPLFINTAVEKHMIPRSS